MLIVAGQLGTGGNVVSGETDLSELLNTLSADLVEGVYVFVTLPDTSVPKDASPRMVFREAEGTTLILLKSEAEAHGLAHEFPCRMITLDVIPPSKPSDSLHILPPNSPGSAWR